ncbi:hypothetical protein ACIQ9L_44900, partial [Streptomyces sp. NPDC094468]
HPTTAHTHPDVPHAHSPRTPDNNPTTHTTTHTTTPTPPQPHEPPAPPHNTNQPPPYKIQRKAVSFLGFVHNSVQVGEEPRELIHQMAAGVFKVSLHYAKAGLPPLSIEIIGHSNGLRDGFAHHGLAKERGLERANAVADHFRGALSLHAELEKSEGRDVVDPGLIQITPRTAGNDLPHGASLDEDPYVARRRVVVWVNLPVISDLASPEHDQAAEGSTTAHRPSQEERGEEAELQQLTDQIYDEFYIELDSEEGIRAAVDGLTDPDVIAEIKPVPWTVRRLRHVAAALKHYKPILGKNRDTSSRSGIEQEVNTIGNVTWLVDHADVHQIDPTVVGQYSYSYETLNLATYSQFPEFTATHELAHGLLEYAEPQFKNEFWAGVGRPSASTPLEDFTNAIADHLRSPARPQEIAPRYATAIARLDVHEPGVIKILPGETHHDAVKRIVDKLGLYLSWFMGETGTWTADGRPDIFFPRERPITEYGKTDSSEDLAETAAVYFTDIDRLRSGAPLRAEFMDRLVEGWKQRREADVSVSANQNHVTRDPVPFSQRRQPDGGTEGHRTHIDSSSGEPFLEVHGHQTQDHDLTDSLNLLRDAGTTRHQEGPFGNAAKGKERETAFDGELFVSGMDEYLEGDNVEKQSSSFLGGLETRSAAMLGYVRASEDLYNALTERERLINR